MTPQSAIRTYTFASATALAVEARFDGGRLTSDGGLPWLAEAEGAVGICAAFAACVPEWRRAHIAHSLETLVRQRVFQMACGYEDQDDADSLRTDPLLKLVCGRRPESDADLASQPTMSRLENAVDRHACMRLAHALVEVYVRAREQGGRPAHILLDIASTDDPTHGQQEGTAYHGYYGQHMYHPLLIFDGETDQLLTALLRPGNAHASRGVRSVLRVLVPLLRARWPGVAIEIRADSGCAVPALYTFCEREKIAYTIGLIPNSRLEAVAAPLLTQAQQQQATTGQTVRLVAETSYQAGSWETERRVVYKAEALDKGPNTRFVVTSRADPPERLYDFYVDRGEPELWIKDLKRACLADRLSDCRFWANQFRLLLHAAAYWLLDTLRRWLCAQGYPFLQLDTLRLRLLKIGARVRELLTRVRLHLASGHPGHFLWSLLALRE
ncbi:MAG: IS1380 family transposase [Ktedonobacterales bacterium]